MTGFSIRWRRSFSKLTLVHVSQKTPKFEAMLKKFETFVIDEYRVFMDR